MYEVGLMAFMIVNTTSDNAEKLLRKWMNGSRRETARKYFIRKLGPGTYLMKANGAALALLYDLKMKYNDSVYIFIAESLEVEPEYPSKIVEVVKACRKNGRNILEKDLKLLEGIEIKCSVSWNRS